MQPVPSSLPETPLIRSSLHAAVVLVLASFTPAAAQSTPVSVQQGPSAGPTSAQEAPTLQDGIALIQRGDPAGAAEVLRTVTEREPENGSAWTALGFALRAAGRFEEAVAAYEVGLPLRGGLPALKVTAGMARAQAGDLDGAFEWLMEAREGGADVTVVDLDPAGAILREDPRWAGLMPSAAEFADPFVEPAEILQEWRGEGRGDQFGWIARNIGDVDGDGVDDVTTSAPTWSADGGAPAGRVYTYSSGTGALLWTADGDPGDQLGLGIESAGDADGDGVPDVVAGAPGGDRTYVYSGVDGRVIHTLEAPLSGSFFGRKVSDVGDVDGDGHGDVLVGAPADSTAGRGAGRAFVHSGRDGSILATLTGEEAGDSFGSAVGGTTEDGTALLVVGAPNAGPGDRGRTYVFRGLDPEPDFVIESDSVGAQLGGMFVSAVGDVDGDGRTDVYASDWGAAGDDGRPGVGRIYVHSGLTGERLHTLSGEAPGDGFGIGTADVGDVDLDGHADLVVGAWQHAGAAPSGGKIYLYSGATSELVRVLTGKVPGETFGFDTTGMGDVDGDGIVDFLITSAWSAVNGGRSGRMFIVSGASGAPPA